MDVVEELLLAVVISLPGFVLPIGALALNRMRRRPGARAIASVLAFVLLFYAFNVSHLAIWCGLLPKYAEALPPGLPAVSFVAVEMLGAWASYVAVRDA